MSAAASVRLALAAAVCAGASVLTGGCSSASVGAASGAAAGVATGIVTVNPAVGIGVGIAVQAATDEVVKNYMRDMHTDQQNLIAALAGTLAIGETRSWSVKHAMPVENGHGHVRVTRAFTSALASCKDFVFSVQDGDDPGAHEAWYTGSACQQGQDKGWKWALAEPAVDRWGNLQ
ncbi:hypothetical protein [Paraburkholderia gardini]|uniref:Lipoprotein n=1 Tax=Paraburkholderia gardini TaxID=2823469 RepID=A0ABM8TXK9_9BURK|nr:hypothetical protein [Paraburkholderia gardini]CAG4886407.1 hypothetical protein R54767_00206 [Paraburkholderia gardini]CAG4895921.1 hypothetical protein R69919_02096 [Paraburkholderia gardini]